MSETIGFVGIGNMGWPMAASLSRAGYGLVVADARKAVADNFVQQIGGRTADTLAGLAAAADIVITMLPTSAHVAGVLADDLDHLLAGLKPGSVVIDMTSGQPAITRALAARVAALGSVMIDAPVSGGVSRAKTGELAIMVGGDAVAFEAVKPLFELMGTTLVLQGGPGAGQHTKMANQIVIAGNLAGAVEAITYANKAGLDPRRVLESIGSGSAGSWQLSTMVPRMLDGNFEPGFYVKHFLKDLRIALEAAHAMKIDLPFLAMAETLFAFLEKEGYGERGTQALYLLYERGLLPGLER